MGWVTIETMMSEFNERGMGVYFLGLPVCEFES